MAALLVALAVSMAAGTVTAPVAAAPVAAAPGGLGPYASIIDDLIETLKDVEKELEDADAAIGTNLGPLVDPDLTAVGHSLGGAESLIDDVLNPGTYPSLDPPTAGSVDTSISPSDLPGYAHECVDLIKDAIAELAEMDPDDDLIGTKLKTIKAMLPDYRTESGI